MSKTRSQGENSGVGGCKQMSGRMRAIAHYECERGEQPGGHIIFKFTSHQRRTSAVSAGQNSRLSGARRETRPPSRVS